MTLPPEYEADFNDLVSGLREDLAAHQTVIYRQIEAQIIAVYKELQRIQREVITKIAAKIPGSI